MKAINHLNLTVKWATLATFSILGAIATGAVGAADALAQTADHTSTGQDSTTITQTAPDNSDEQVVSRTQINRVHVGSSDTQVAPAPQQAGTAAAGTATHDTIDRTEITETRAQPSAFRDEAVGILPQIGYLSLSDGQGGSTSRGVAGLTMDFNFLGRLSSHNGKPFAGLSIGALYSHLGLVSSDFFGANGTSTDGSNATSLLLFPIDAKIGYTFRDIARLSIHTGATLLYYTNNGNGFNANASASAASNSGTIATSTAGLSASPNFGLDLELGLGRDVALLLRPDWTFANNTIFSGTIGLTLPIS